MSSTLTRHEAVRDQLVVDVIQRNNERFRQTLNDIYARFDKDLSSTADEVDLLTGRVYVSKGHLTRIGHDNDAHVWTDALCGSSDSSDTEQSGEEDDEAELNDTFVDTLAALGYLPDAASPARRTSRPITLDDSSGPQLLDDNDGNHLSDADESVSEYGDDEDEDEDKSASDEERPSRRQLARRNPLSLAEAVQRASRAVALREASANMSVVVDSAFIAALGQRIANEFHKYLREQNIDVGGQVYLPYGVEDFPLPSITRILGAGSPPSSSVRSPSRGPSLWSFPGQTNYFSESRKRKRIGSRWEPIAICETSPRPISPSPEPQVMTDLDSLQKSADTAYRMLAYGIDTNTPRRRGSRRQDDSDSDDGYTSRDGLAAQKARKVRFTKEEDRTVKILREIHEMQWRDIVKHLPGRTIRSVQTRYVRKLSRLPPLEDTYIKREVVEIDSDEERAMNLPMAPAPLSTISPAPGSSLPISSFAPMYANGLPNHHGSHMLPPHSQAATHQFMHAYSGPARPTHPPMHPAPVVPLSSTAPPTRYNQFDTNHGAGSFGILKAPRSQTRMHPPVAPSRSSFGVCGIIRPPPKTGEKKRSKKGSAKSQLVSASDTGAPGAQRSQTHPLTPAPTSPHDSNWSIIAPPSRMGALISTIKTNVSPRSQTASDTGLRPTDCDENLTTVTSRQTELEPSPADWTLHSPSLHDTDRTAAPLPTCTQEPTVLHPPLASQMPEMSEPTRAEHSRSALAAYELSSFPTINLQWQEGCHWPWPSDIEPAHVDPSFGHRTDSMGGTESYELDNPAVDPEQASLLPITGTEPRSSDACPSSADTLIPSWSLRDVSGSGNTRSSSVSGDGQFFTTRPVQHIGQDATRSSSSEPRMATLAQHSTLAADKAPKRKRERLSKASEMSPMKKNPKKRKKKNFYSRPERDDDWDEFA